MRRVTMALLLAFLLLGGGPPAMPAAADAPAALDAADRARIVTVIGQQIDAFRHDDGVAAFGFASPAIQAMFGAPGPFLDMVRTAYAPVYRPRSVEFRDLVDQDGRPTQRVLLVGPDGRAVMAYYTMQRQPDGSWRIDGCVLMEVDEVAA